jgi:lysophospholipase L1-like esterase
MKIVIKYLSIYCLLFGVVFAQTKVDLENDQKLISSSQAGASPLFFDVKNANIPVIDLTNKQYPDEFFIRKGVPNFVNKAKGGDSVKIGFLGGSITKAENLYRTQTAKYIQGLFPKAKMIGLNAGVSGTGSDLGACRVSDQLLIYKPDLIFIEFAVNGAYAPGIEGIIRQIRKQLPETDVCLIYTISEGQAEQYTAGLTPKNIASLEKIAAYYEIPSVHMGLSVGDMQKEGALIWKDKVASKDQQQIVFSRDGLHPTVAGGNLYAAAIGRAFKAMENEKASQSKYTLKEPLLNDNWEDAKMLDPKKYALFEGKWEAIDPVTTSTINLFKPWFPYVLKASKPGASFTFKFKGDLFGLFDIGGPEVGKLEIFVDEEKLSAEVIKFESNRFNSFCNNRYRGQYVKFKVPYGEHKVRVVISNDLPDKATILGASQLNDITQYPDKYNQSVIYLGKILIKGEPIGLQ